MSEEKKSYSRIVKSSSLIGGAQGVNMLIGMIRVKFVAILIGPVGIGLVATYQSLLQLIGTIAGLGLQSSAVRDIAQAVSSGKEEQTARIVLSLRRMCWLTGGLGSLAVILLSPLLSQITFNSPDYTVDISLVGLTIFIANLKGGQMALIQGHRRIGDLAKLNVFGAVSGSIISVLLYWQYGLDGIVPALVCLSITELIASWWFARKITLVNVTMSWKESFQEAGGMVKLGFIFMWNSLLIAVVAYLTRLLITQEISLLAVGIFSAAYALSGLIVNFIMSAMAADFYPSLVSVNQNDKKICQMVNQQTEIGLLFATPFLLATLAFAPYVIQLFYTSEFNQSADLLRWFAIGCIGRVLSNPLGYAILAKGFTRLYAVVETVIQITHIVLIIVMLELFGLEGVSIAYPALYLIYTVGMLVILNKMIKFTWSKHVLTIVMLLSSIVFVVLLTSLLLPENVSIFVGVISVVTVSYLSILNLILRLGGKHKLIKVLRKIPIINKMV